MNTSDSSHPSDDWNSSSPEEFLAIMRHELRNPIAVMKGWVEILSNESTRDHHPKAIEIISQKIDVIEKLHQRLGEYVDTHRQNPDP